MIGHGDLTDELHAALDQLDAARARVAELERDLAYSGAHRDSASDAAMKSQGELHTASTQVERLRKALDGIKERAAVHGTYTSLMSFAIDIYQMAQAALTETEKTP